jgi:hypothetical protein
MKPWKDPTRTKDHSRRPEPVGAPAAPVARFEVFRGTIASWQELFDQAAAFASRIGPDRLITIAHSEDQQDGVVAVWYWDNLN